MIKLPSFNTIFKFSIVALFLSLISCSVLGVDRTSAQERDRVSGKLEKTESDFPRFAVRLGQQNFLQLRNSVELLDLDSPFTVEVWYRWTGGEVYQSILSNKSWPGMNDKVPSDHPIGWTFRLIHVRGSEYQLDFTAADGRVPQAWFEIRSQAFQLDQEWHHLAASRTVSARGDSEIRLFIDGKMVTRRRLEDVVFRPSYTDLFIGVRENPNAERRITADLAGVRLSKVGRYSTQFKPEPVFEADEDSVFVLDMNDIGAFEVRNLVEQDHAAIPNGIFWVPIHKEGPK